MAGHGKALRQCRKRNVAAAPVICAVTGAPDYEGGSEIGFTVYYLNGEHTRYLQVTIGFAAVFDAAMHTVVEYITEPIA